MAWFQKFHYMMLGSRESGAERLVRFKADKKHRERIPLSRLSPSPFYSTWVPNIRVYAVTVQAHLPS